MKRSDFLKLISLAPLAACNMKLKDFEREAQKLAATPKMPALFVGHGSPTNAIEENNFTRMLAALGKRFSGEMIPSAIMVVSAHWLTQGTFVSTVEKPETIYDFGGFQDELYQIKYEAPGAPALAEEVAGLSDKIKTDKSWGLDHGAWTILKYIFPKADIPVFQMSIDYYKPMQYHYDLAVLLNSLRKKGVLVIGSGNLVHNLSMSFPKFMSNDANAYDWAIEFDAWIKDKLEKNDHKSLINYLAAGKAAELSVPTPDHYIPLLYSAALREADEEVTMLHDEVYYGGISMRTFGYGLPSV